MTIRDQKNGRSRWEACKEAITALAYKAEQKDAEGMTLYMFAGRFKRYDKVTAAKVTEIYEENEPGGGTELGDVLEDAFQLIAERKSKGNNVPELVLVITDGEPDNRESVAQSIARMSHKIKDRSELAVSFIQVGTDPSAAEFLKSLDDDLTKAGAALDIVDTVTLEEMEEYSLTEIFDKAFKD
jgi:uncharacterized protein YegL